MKIVVALLLLATIGTAYADETGERVAWRRSTNIAKMIVQGQTDLKKATGYGDELDYHREVTGHLVKQLQWWREEQALYRPEFEPYDSCLSAGAAFNHYADAVWAQPGLRRDREMREQEAQYISELKSCQRVLKRHANRAT